jgi:hypothetical protein
MEHLITKQYRVHSYLGNYGLFQDSETGLWYIVDTLSEDVIECLNGSEEEAMASLIMLTPIRVFRHIK